MTVRNTTIVAAWLSSLLVFSASYSFADASTSVSVLTINLRSHFDRASARIPAIQQFTAKHKPDIVMLQEVGQRSRTTQAHQLANGEYHVAHHHNGRTNRGLAILSRANIVSSQVIRLPVSGRPALIATVKTAGGLISVVNLHLTPPLDAVGTRLAELSEVLRVTKSLPGVHLVGGDFNFGDASLESALLGGFVDTFRAVQPASEGYTWDLKNPLALKNSYPREPSRRLDRILVHGESVNVDDCRVVLNSETDRGSYPSDHFGVLAKVTILSSSVEVEKATGVGHHFHSTPRYSLPVAHRPTLSR